MDYVLLNKNCELYPNKLKLIKNPPSKLYAIGNLNLLEKDMIAVVGTRNITGYGIRMAEYFCKELALREIPIISGMAIGTDTIAHKMALKYGTPTIAVLGTGLNNVYPKENKKLYKDIIESGGLVLSEVGLDVKYNSKNFPKRNRIVSGLSEGVLVIEAGYRSGTSITVKYAREQGKMVFVVPSSLENTYGIGANNMIKTGANLVTEVEDILRVYPQFLEKKRKTYSQKNIKSEYVEIYNLIKNRNYTTDELYKIIKGKGIREISNILTMMELEGLIIQDFGNGYKIKENDE